MNFPNDLNPSPNPEQRLVPVAERIAPSFAAPVAAPVNEPAPVATDFSDPSYQVQLWESLYLDMLSRGIESSGLKKRVQQVREWADQQKAG